ncbi:hypothetical protein N7481_012794 [Penicillium waksmanii]|uniref:uncharacterized protein n=1 Tax=Penicillium waksmanii TaxID=69791 RepID=UPI00254773D9|nr:uncharacterized protein N7481_012794 [Penicillium waksmanii]KAJ5966080.1 hypothetical protein N7481_012794 [Penicillium waksmanii]
MDPVSAFGLISGGIQVLQAITSTVHGLNQLYGKFKDADLTIQSLIQELNCIGAALTSLKEWTRLNSADGLQSEEYSRDLAVAMDGCRVIMEVVSHDVSTLVQQSRENGVAGIRTRMRVVWNEETMRGHQEKLRSQVMALQLLLQVRLLRTATTRKIFHRVADDTATILSSRGSRATSYADSMSQSSRHSVSDSDFDFHRAIAESPAYRRTLDPIALTAASLDQPQLPIAESDHSPFAFTGTDEGYASNRTETTSLTVPSLNIPASKSEEEGYFPLPSSPSGPVRHPTSPLHSRSVSHTQNSQQQHQAPIIRRNASDSKAQKLRTSGSKRERFSSLLGMSTRSRANLAVSPGVSPNPSANNSGSGSLRRRQRLEGDLRTSIDLTAKHEVSVPQIIKAAQAGSRDEVERLIEQGCDIEARHSRSSRNALLVAAHCGYDDVVDLLIQNHAKLNIVDRGGWTALHLSASRGHRAVLEVLLEEGRDLLETPSFHGQTALRVAADFGQLEAAYTLLAHHAQVNSRAENQMTALHAAAKRGDSEIIQMLISHGADLEAKDGNMMTALHHACEEDNRAAIEVLGRERKTPLICAAEAGRSRAVKLLLKRKANSRIIDETGMTALHWAAYNGHEETVGILSEKKGSLDAVNNMGRTALHLATIQSRFAVVDSLQRKGMQLDKRCNTGLTALHYACMADSFEITRLLLMTGADVEASETQHQQRPLHIAAARGSVPILELLCERGATLDARNGFGDRPACVASRFGHVGAVQKLLDRGSPVCLKFETGFREDSLLCLAALGGHWAVASLLLARGASIVKKDETGWAPVRYAAYHGHTSILQLFLSSNKIPNANLPEIIQLPQTIGFAPMVSPEKKVEVQQLLGQSLRYPAPVAVPASTQGPVPGPISVQGPVPRPLPAPISEPVPSRREQAANAISTAYTSPASAPFASEAGSTAIYELPTSPDRESADGNHSTTTSVHMQRNMTLVEPTSTAIVGQRVLTPEMRHPEPTQAVAGDRIAALLHGAHDVPAPRPASTSTSTVTSAPGPGRSRDREAPQLSATYTPVSFIYSPTPSPPVRSYAVPHRGRNSVLITPPLAEQSVDAARVPRSLPTYENTGPRNESAIRKEEQDGDLDSDSDSDSISSVYTAPEGDADVSISNTTQEISVQERT